MPGTYRETHASTARDFGMPSTQGLKLSWLRHTQIHAARGPSAPPT
jgi:hypothetical protein